MYHWNPWAPLFQPKLLIFSKPLINSNQNNTVQKIASPPPTLGTCVWAVQPSPRQTLLHACRSHSDPALPITGGSLQQVPTFPLCLRCCFRSETIPVNNFTLKQKRPNSLFFHTKQTTSSKAAWLSVPAWTAAHCSNCTSQREWLVIDGSSAYFLLHLSLEVVFFHETTTFSVAQVHHLSRQRSCSTKALVVLWKVLWSKANLAIHATYLLE